MKLRMLRGYIVQRTATLMMFPIFHFVSGRESAVPDR